MTVFKTFYKIMLEYKVMLIIYTVMLIGLTLTNFTSGNSMTDFTQVKPDVVIINHDDSPLSKAVYSYMENNTNIKQVDNIDDALYYRDISYVMTIPKEYGSNFMKGMNPNIGVQTNGDYNGSYSTLLLDRFLKTANTYRLEGYNEQDISIKTNDLLKENIVVEMQSKLDTNALSKTNFFYSFLSYALLAGCVYIIAMTMASFQDVKIRKRTTISSLSFRKYNNSLFLGSCLFGFLLWIVYTLLAFIVLNKTMFTMNGLLFILNSFVFMLCCISISLIIGKTLKNKEAIAGIVNVVALGSSFICGAFIPLEWIPDNVLIFSRFLPTYWFIQNNELISKLEVFNFETLKPILTNGLIVVGFMFLFIIITNVITSKNRKIN